MKGKYKVENELISIIMPTYNRKHTIAMAIDSILNQTYKNFELIIVDDCSNDNTDELIKRYEDKRIKYIKLEKNSGANFARNVGIKSAKGQYITFQDSDDFSYSNRLEKELENLKENKVDWVFANFKKINGKKVKVLPERKIESSKILEELLFKNCVTTQTLFGKKEIFLELEFDEALPRFQDWDLAIRIAKKYKGYHINEVFIDMYIQEDSITKNPQKGYKALNIILKKYEKIFNSKQKARLYCRIGTFKMLCGNNAEMEFKKCINEEKKNIKYRIIYFLYKLKLYKKIYYWIKK